MKSLATIKNNSPVFFITPNPIYAIGLEKIIENYFVICSQKYDIIDYLKKEKIPILFLNNSKITDAGKILMDEKVIKYIKEKSKNQKANIISFKPSPMIAKICEKNNFNYLGNNWKLNRDLEDKIKFIKVTEKLKIPNAESEVIKLDEDNFSLKATFRNVALKEKFVIQLPRGFSGNATFLIKNKNDLNKILEKYKNRKVKISKYLKGETHTINACVTKNKILISQPIFQITGFSLYNKNSFGGTCGNDYVYGFEGDILECRLQDKEIKKIFNYTKKVGEYLRNLNYKGIFGLDFVVSKNEINLIEINPRIIGSMSLFTKLQIQNKETPFLLSHILEFVNSREFSSKGDTPECRLQMKIKSSNFNASQLILRNTKSKPIKIVKSLKSGIYGIKENKLVFKKEAYYISKDLKKNEFLIQCSSVNRIVNPDIEYANIQVNYGIMKKEKEFGSYFSSVIKKVLKEIKIKIVTLSNC